MQKDPEDRYQSSRDLVVDLRNLRRQSDSGVTESLSSVTAVQKMRKSNRIQYLIGGLVIVIAVVMYFGRMIFDSDSGSASSGIRGLQAKPNALAIVGFQNKTGDSELD